jgi:hypothetical protein
MKLNENISVNVKLNELENVNDAESENVKKKRMRRIRNAQE